MNEQGEEAAQRLILLISSHSASSCSNQSNQLLLTFHLQSVCLELRVFSRAAAACWSHVPARFCWQPAMPKITARRRLQASPHIAISFTSLSFLRVL